MADKRRDDLTTNSTDANRDPLTGEPGAHPVGVGLGAAAGGAATGAAGGAVAGPIGAAVGAVIGGVVGGLAGKGAAESVDPTTEDAYWRENHTSRPYHTAGTSYDEYRPAYQYGWESRNQHAGKSWDEAEPDLQRGWESAKANSRLTWEHAKHATKDAWHRVEDTVAGRGDTGTSGNVR